MENHCQLCGRERDRLTRHHLIPNTVHSNKWFKSRFSKEELLATIGVCRDCHMNIHKLIDEKEMGKNHNTVETLLANEKVAGFVEWIAKR